MSDLNDDLVLMAIKCKLTDFDIKWALQTTQTDEEFSYSNGVKTATIARELNMKTSDTRKVLREMQCRGLLYSHKGAVTFTWWPVGYLDELKTTLYS